MAKTRHSKEGPPCFIEGRPGFAFKDGKLYFFEKDRVLVMSSWPDPRAWFKKRSHGWKATRQYADRILYRFLFPASSQDDEEKVERIEPQALPSGQYLLPGVLYDDYAWCRELDRKNRITQGRYFDMIPPLIRDELLKYRTRRWHAMNLFARCPGALDLHHSNPGLFYALASNWVFHKPAVKLPMRAARGLINKKQKQILTWLGFPGTENARRILSKIKPCSLSIESLLYLRNSFDDPFVVKCFSHLETINTGALSLMLDYKFRSLITSRLIEDISKDEAQDIGKYPPILWMMSDILRMAQTAGPNHCPQHFVSLKRLKEVHDELSDRYQRGMIAGKGALPSRFDDPPFSGTEDIRPIPTPDDLYFEGNAMHHCVASYASTVAEGKAYIYRVMAPVRATLSISRENGQWVPGQLFGACNKPVNEYTRETIFEDLFQSKRNGPTDKSRGRGHALGVVDPALNPLFTTPVDTRQLPLLPPEQMAKYWECVECFRE